jgi:hypothetical protein
MAYVLPRAILVLLLWGATYWLLTELSTEVPAAVVYMTGIAWALAGVVCFGYIRKLRREMDSEQGQRFGAGPNLN